MSTTQRTLRVGVPLDPHGNIARHFGHSVAFRFYEVSHGAVRLVGDAPRPLDPQPEVHHTHSHSAPRHRHGDGHGDGHGHGDGRGGGNGRWIAEAFEGCDVVLTAGLGAGARRNLQGLGARVVVTDHPRDPDAAVELLAQGKL